METKLISGTLLQKEILEEVKTGVIEIQKNGITPGLVTIVVGNNPASLSYITAKQQISKDLGMYAVLEHLDDNISQEALLSLIDQYNNDDKIHGILVQTPLPNHIDEISVLSAIDKLKDVDCFNPYNVGMLSVGKPIFLPCTPSGVQQMLIRSNIETSGKKVVVIGRSNIVGKPMASIMLQKGDGANATVTLCHTGTLDLKQHTLDADIIIVASGQPNTLTGDMVKDGVVVIDVGVNRVGMNPNGKAKLVGDVDFESVSKKASYISPVPGGVGPMTIAMLMSNVLKAAHYDKRSN